MSTAFIFSIINHMNIKEKAQPWHTADRKKSVPADARVGKQRLFQREECCLERRLKKDNEFNPCPIDTGDELFPNGIFVFNITKIVEYIQKNHETTALEEVAVSDFCKDFSSINESHVDSVDISKPVILAEISPGRYHLVDGSHRMEKAGKMGIYSIRAYKLDVEHHIQFLTSKKAYMAYVDYWNDKVKQKAKWERFYKK